MRSNAAGGPRCWGCTFRHWGWGGVVALLPYEALRRREGEGERGYGRPVYTPGTTTRACVYGCGLYYSQGLMAFNVLAALATYYSPGTDAFDVLVALAVGGLGVSGLELACGRLYPTPISPVCCGARFNNPKVLSLLQTMSSIVLPCRRGCPVGTRRHKYRCRQRTTALALRTIHTTARHIACLCARPLPTSQPHASLETQGGGGARYWAPGC